MNTIIEVDYNDSYNKLHGNMVSKSKNKNLMKHVEKNIAARYTG